MIENMIDATRRESTSRCRLALRLGDHLFCTTLKRELHAIKKRALENNEN